MIFPVLILGESYVYAVCRVQAGLATTMCCGTTTTLIQMSCSASPISYATRTFAVLAPCRSLRLPTMLTLLRSVPATILLRKNMTGRSTINYLVQVLEVQVFNNPSCFQVVKPKLDLSVSKKLKRASRGFLRPKSHK